MRDNIALIGFMGVGKTSVAQELSRICGMSLVDIDAEIEKTAQMPIFQIFCEYGEEHFRHLEYEFCRKIPAMSNCVIATGGGIVLDHRNRAILRGSATVVYLSARANTIFARLSGENQRPLLANNNIAKIKALLAARKPLYLATMHFCLETDSLNINTCAQQIHQSLIIHY